MPKADLLSRREFVQRSVLGCALCARGHAASNTRDSDVPMLQSFGYADVQLDDGPLRTQHRHQQNLFLGIDNDALLKPFRSRAGLPAPGPDMGGWYDDSSDFHIDPNDWSTANWHGFIPGHSFGQYLSGLARGFAASGDASTRAKIHQLVDLYSATISAKFFDGYTLPCYTFDKIAVGLIDAHRHASAPGAIQALARTTEAALRFFPPKAVTREERRAMPHTSEAQIWDEPYTLPENLFIADSLGMGPYGAIARKYLADDSLFDALAANRSPFKGKHAYSHVNALSSAIQAYYTTGKSKYLRAARNGFAFVEAQSYATGGWGPNEELIAADDTQTLFKMLGDTQRSFETPCGAYAHFKIARSLLQITKNSAYGDSMERVLYNTVLGALPTLADGRTFYYSDYSSKARKVYRGEAWPCCSGTFVQLAADYGISAWLFDADSVYVNLYVPSRVSATLPIGTLQISQATEYPFGDTSRIVLERVPSKQWTLQLRIPAWSGPRTTVGINGKQVPESIRPGSFLALRRAWNTGDVVEIHLDRTTRLEALDAHHPDLVALLNGPLVLFPIEPTDQPLTRQELLSSRKLSEHEWKLGDEHATRARPFTDIGGETYRLYSRLASRAAG